MILKGHTYPDICMPTNTTSDIDKDEFYEQLINVVDATPEHDMKIVLGDLNAQIGFEGTGWEEVIRKNAAGDLNNNGKRLLSFCSSNRLKIGGSLFNHKIYTKAHDGNTQPDRSHLHLKASFMQDLLVHRYLVHRGADI